MFDKIRKELTLKRMQLQFSKGVVEQKIIPFDEDFYNQMSRTYFNGIPVSMHIKYLKPMPGMPGGCYDRSLFMFFCFPDALLVRGDNKDLEIMYGKENAGHGWIEIGNYVYDPSLMARFDKDLYYKIYSPTNVTKSTKEEYCSLGINRELYEDITSTTIQDLQPYGRKRLDLSMGIPLVRGIAELSGNQDFINDLNKHLAMIQYDEKQVSDELHARVRELAMKENFS